MKRPPETGLAGPLLATLIFLSAARAEAAAPDVLVEGWYQVEMLVFVRDEAIAQPEEQWPPLPELAYPTGYRFLIEPDLADRRLRESAAFASRIDDRGVQHLIVPRSPSALDLTPRPDALIREPYVEPEEASGEGPQVDGQALQAPPLLAAPMAPEAEPDDGGVRPVATIPLVRPEVTLPVERLEFRRQAAGLRRRGQRVLFHESWWTRLAQDGPKRLVALDRSADMDGEDWPELQGIVTLYRSRYLHAEVDLWINTMAPYLPDGWQIAPPPKAKPSLTAHTLQGEARNPWSTDDGIDGVGRELAPLREPLPPTPPAEAGAPVAEPYPWRHAVRHRQTRRMRSGEIHYLDHPALGVILRLSPAGEERLPIAEEADLAFGERHGFSLETIDAPPASDGPP